jgi:hypothetical protein
MKASFLKIAVIVLIASSFTACKRGENDPFLSVKSRNARITGKWVLKTSQYIETYSNNYDGPVISEITKIDYADGFLATTLPNGDVYAVPYTFEVIINKNGTYAQSVVTDGIKVDTEGYWWWQSDTKDKVRIAFDDDINSFYIDQLKDKELILKQNTFDKTTEPNGYFESTTTTLTSKYVKR